MWSEDSISITGTIHIYGTSGASDAILNMDIALAKECSVSNY